MAGDAWVMERTILCRDVAEAILYCFRIFYI